MILIFMSEQNTILSENLNLNTEISELKRPYWYLQNATEREGVGRNIQDYLQYMSHNLETIDKFTPGALFVEDLTQWDLLQNNMCLPVLFDRQTKV